MVTKDKLALHYEFREDDSVNSSNIVYSSGQIIPEANIESYMVWIPRYKYKLFNVESASKSPQEIEIVFESKNMPISNGTTNGSYLTHPAFTSFDVNGIWVGKFEVGYSGATTTTSARVNSSDANKIIVKPNVYSWRSIQVANAHTASYNYKRDLDSHMMKNTEWGAVAYLSHSKYGINKEIRLNNNNTFKTSCGALTENLAGVSACDNAYGTVSSYPQTTTGNITGIFDISGGTTEYVMGVIEDTSGNPMSGNSTSSNSGFNGKLNDGTSITNGKDFPNSKYYNSYKNNMASNKAGRILGDATGEMAGWYQDYASFINSSYSWFLRGCGYDNGTGAGAFCFGYEGGSAFGGLGFRLVFAL